MRLFSRFHLNDRGKFMPRPEPRGNPRDNWGSIRREHVNDDIMLKNPLGYETG
jgi:hypothetical protein